MFEDASRVANDAVGNIRTVAAFGSEDKVMQLYRDKCSMPLKAGVRKALVSGFGMAFSQFVMFANYSLAFWYGGQLVEQGVTSFQSVFQVEHQSLFCYSFPLLLSLSYSLPLHSFHLR